MLFEINFINGPLFARYVTICAREERHMQGPVIENNKILLIFWVQKTHKSYISV